MQLGFSDFAGLVYHAFEAVLESPEVTRAAAIMGTLDHDHSADILKRITFIDSVDWSSLKGHHGNTVKGLTAFLKAGTITTKTPSTTN